MSTYENLIAANNALMECYKQTEPSSYESITPFDKNLFPKMKENQYLNLSQIEPLHSFSYRKS